MRWINYCCKLGWISSRTAGNNQSSLNRSRKPQNQLESISKQIEKMSQIKKRVKTGHKRTGDQNEVRHQKKKTGQARLVKLCRPHYLFLQVESKGIIPNKDFIYKTRILWKNYYLTPYKSIKNSKISIRVFGLTQRDFRNFCP